MKFTTDNGAMIAYVGHRRMGLGERDETELAVRARWPLNELSPAINFRFESYRLVLASDFFSQYERVNFLCWPYADQI